MPRVLVCLFADNCSTSEPGIWGLSMERVSGIGDESGRWG